MYNKNFTNTMAAAGELAVRCMSDKAQKGYALAGDTFRKIYRYSEDEYYTKGSDNRIAGPFCFQSLEMSLESWVPTIEEFIEDHEYMLIASGYTLEDLAEMLLAEGFDKTEIESWTDINGESFLQFTSEDQ